MGQRGLDMPGRTQVVVVRPDLSLGLWGVCVYRRGAVSPARMQVCGVGVVHSTAVCPSFPAQSRAPTLKGRR